MHRFGQKYFDGLIPIGKCQFGKTEIVEEIWLFLCLQRSNRGEADRAEDMGYI